MSVQVDHIALHAGAACFMPFSDAGLGLRVEVMSQGRVSQACSPDFILGY